MGRFFSCLVAVDYIATCLKCQRRISCLLRKRLSKSLLSNAIPRRISIAGYLAIYINSFFVMLHMSTNNGTLTTTLNPFHEPDCCRIPSFCSCSSLGSAVNVSFWRSLQCLPECTRHVVRCATPSACEIVALKWYENLYFFLLFSLTWMVQIWYFWPPSSEVAESNSWRPLLEIHFVGTGIGFLTVLDAQPSVQVSFSGLDWTSFKFISILYLHSFPIVVMKFRSGVTDTLYTRILSDHSRWWWWMASTSLFAGHFEKWLYLERYV